MGYLLGPLDKEECMECAVDSIAISSGGSSSDNEVLELANDSRTRPRNDSVSGSDCTLEPSNSGAARELGNNLDPSIVSILPFFEPVGLQIASKSTYSR